MTVDEVAALRAEVAELRELVRSVLPKTEPWIPPHATLAGSAKIHPTVRLRCRADTPISIGARTSIYAGTELTGPVTIGSGCFINRDGYLRPGTILGDRVFVGPFVRLITDGHELEGSEQRAGKNTSQPIVVGDGAWIGAGSTVLGGVTIGAGTIVAAGSLVNKDFPDNALVGGVPARIIRFLKDEPTPRAPRQAPDNRRSRQGPDL